jgi:hypothetical protein
MEWIRFILFLFLDRINRIIRIFSPAAKGLSAEGRIIQMILLTCPLVPLRINSFLRGVAIYIYSFGRQIALAWLAGPVQLFSLRYESIPLFL